MEDEEENSKRMNEEGWEKRVFTSIALMSPSTEWRAQSYWKIFKKKNTHTEKLKILSLGTEINI